MNAMILQPCNVELTKVHYYDKNKTERNWVIPTISREIDNNNFNSNIIIKKNVFGQRWVLKINDDKSVKKKSKTRVIIYVIVICSLISAVCFGIFYSIENMMCLKQHTNTKSLEQNLYQATGPNYEYTLKSRNISTSEKNDTASMNSTSNNQSPIQSFCFKCILKNEICMKKQTHEKPTCVKPINENDPTGCGGLCRINTHYCQTLDNKAKVYQCSLLKNILRCPNNTFNCGNMCVPLESKCDGKFDCSNGSDERNCVCNLTTHFQCGNFTSCLENHKKCDRKVDCWDKSDEQNCHILNSCSESELPCYDGQCIAKENFCDGKYDCLDKSDEPDGCQ